MRNWILQRAFQSEEKLDSSYVFRDFCRLENNQDSCQFICSPSFLSFFLSFYFFRYFEQEIQGYSMLTSSCISSSSSSSFVTEARTRRCLTRQTKQREVRKKEIEKYMKRRTIIEQVKELIWKRHDKRGISNFKGIPSRKSCPGTEWMQYQLRRETDHLLMTAVELSCICLWIHNIRLVKKGGGGKWNTTRNDDKHESGGGFFFPQERISFPTAHNFLVLFDRENVQDSETCTSFFLYCSSSCVFLYIKHRERARIRCMFDLIPSTQTSSPASKWFGGPNDRLTQEGISFYTLFLLQPEKVK